MLRKSKKRHMLYGFLSLIMGVGALSGLGNKAYAEVNTAEVSSVEEFQTALDDTSVAHIIITKSFDVPCKTASKQNGTSFFVVDREMKIEGKSPEITLTRTIGEDAENGKLQSLIGIKGNGETEDDKQIHVELRNLTLDGGADFGKYVGIERVKNEASIKSMGACGRSLVDVYYKAVLNLENDLTIQNSYCTYSLASIRDNSGSCRYGGGVRVDWDKDTGGGTVNVKAGSCIKNCATSGDSYGGGIGAYSYAHLNVYGGIIEDCSSENGGAIGCTNRALYGPETAGTFKMTGGILRNNSAVSYGGAISAYGTTDCVNELLGGTIENCSASCGGAVALGEGHSNNFSLLYIAPYEDGTLTIKDCTSKRETSSTTEYGGVPIGYTGLYLGSASEANIDVKGNYVTITFKKLKNDEEDYCKLTIKQGDAMGDKFPANPEWDYRFVEWNTVAEGIGDKITKDTKIENDLTVYARWMLPPEFTVSPDLSIVYGDTDKSIKILDAHADYSGKLTYQWRLKNSEAKLETIDEATDSEYFIPKNPVGTYQYDCVVTNYISSANFSKTSSLITVEVKPQTLNLSWADTDITYNGEAQKPSVSITDGLIDGDEVSVEITGEETEEGTYTATAKLVGKDAGNYVIAEGEDSAEFTIKAAPTPEPTATPTADPTADPEATPSVEPTATPAADSDLTKDIPYAENIPVEEKEAEITSKNTDADDVPGSAHRFLMLKASAKKNSIKLTWKKINGADGYIIYGAKCGKKMEKIATVTNPSKKSYTVKKLKKGTYYKFIVVAYKNTAEAEKVITTAKSIHAATSGGLKGNPISLKVKKSKLKLKAGKTAKIKASYKKKKKVSVHIAKFRYESSNDKVATVDKKGKVTAKGKGTCKIYVFTQNGICKTVNVTVK